MTQNHERGFTYIEILIVLGLVGAIALFGMAFSLSSIARSSVTSERDLFVTLLLRGARAEAIANVSEDAHGIYIDNTCDRYILFTGTAFAHPANCNIVPRQIAFTSGNISITQNPDLGGAHIIVFEQLSGNVTKGAGTITLTNGEATQEIDISEVGQIDW